MHFILFTIPSFPEKIDFCSFFTKRDTFCRVFPVVDTGNNDECQIDTFIVERLKKRAYT